VKASRYPFADVAVLSLVKRLRTLWNMRYEMRRAGI
jgi:hypothetical protein